MDKSLCTKILNAEQIRKADQFTIKNEPIKSVDLMERASEAFAEKFITLYSKKKPVHIFCGTGNNGGDGLVIARLLSNLDYKVKVYILGNPEKGSAEFNINLEIIQHRLEPVRVTSIQDIPELVKKMVIIDAIFGSGLTRPVSGIYGELIDAINFSTCENVVAVDIASGLGCEDVFPNGKLMEVSETITFQVAKLSHLLPQNDRTSGEVHIVDIGLDHGFINSLETNYYQVTHDFVQSIYRFRGRFWHKGNAGRNLIIAGSKGKMGAAVLAAKACLKSGAGLLTMYVPQCGVDIMQTAVPEAMVAPAHNDLLIVEIPRSDPYDAIGIGPGIGTDELTVEAIEKHLGKSKVPLVLDADVLNILAENPDLLNSVKEGSILTPHPGEFKRLVGEWKDDYDRLNLQIDFAKKHKVIVVLKGANTSIATPDGSVFFNSSGNPGMATAGSGDVLTGIVTGLVGQGYAAVEASILGVYLHGLSADIYAEIHGEESLIASDIIDHLGLAFKKAASRNQG